MKKIAIILSALALFTLAGCSSFSALHEKVFGCPPVGYVPPERKLDAKGDDCGKPIYKAPKCARPAPVMPRALDAKDGGCENGTCPR